MNDKNFEYVPKWNTKDKNVTLNNLLNDLKIPRWNQTKVNRLLLIGFGGIGDEFLVARFGKQMREFAKELDYSSSNYLAHIIVKTNFFDKTWNIKYAPRNFEINNEVNLNNFSYYDSWYSPFHNKMEFLPNDLKYTWQNQYIFTNPEYDEKWEKIIKSNKIKIGIKFSGNFQRDLQLGRTLPIESIVSLFDNKKYDLYSFQISEGLEKAEELGLINLKEHIHNWDDTFSALYKMNFVITSCSSVAHASSILGIKTFVLVPHNSYFVWEKCDENNHHSLWYGNNVICLKQLCKGDWSYPINQLQKYLNLKKIKKHIDLIYE